MRTSKAIRNVAYSVLYYSSLLLLSLILRKVFIQYLDVELLGVEGVLGNLFSLMSLVDVGTGSLITYLLYKAYSEDQRDEVSILMGMYRNMYFLIAIAMSIISLLLIPLLPYFITSNTIEWKFVIYIYIIKCIGMVGSYIYSYRRLLFKVAQCEYICTRVDMFFSYIRYFSWFLVIFIWKSYFLYLIVEVTFVFLANMYISHLSYKRFPYATGKNVRLRDFKERNFFKDMKNTYITKISGTIYGSTSNLVISVFLGLRSVAILSNYLLITTTISQGFARFLLPLQGSIGNYVYTETRENSIKLFKMFDMFSFLVGSTIVSCFITVINDFIELWLGQQFQLDMFTIITIGITLYIGFESHFISCFRDVYGKFELERTYAIIGALINIIISILFVRPLGIAGVYIGTISGMIGFWVGRYRVLNRELFRDSLNYLQIQLKFFLIASIITFLSTIVCDLCGKGVIFIFVKMFICLTISVLLNYVVFRNSVEFKDMICYLKSSINIVKSKIK